MISAIIKQYLCQNEIRIEKSFENELIYEIYFKNNRYIIKLEGTFEDFFKKLDKIKKEMYNNEDQNGKK